jgi:hypothetical protein
MQSFRSVEPILRRGLAKDPDAEDHTSGCIVGFWGTVGKAMLLSYMLTRAICRKR